MQPDFLQNSWYGYWGQVTGSFPKTSGFYGNTFWTPPQGSGNTIPVGNSAAATSQDYTDPVFTEDYQVLSTLNTYYSGQLLLVKSLFATAQSAGMVTPQVLCTWQP